MEHPQELRQDDGSKAEIYPGFIPAVICSVLTGIFSWRSSIILITMDTWNIIGKYGE